MRTWNEIGLVSVELAGGANGDIDDQKAAEGREVLKKYENVNKLVDIWSVSFSKSCLQNGYLAG
jgi:hypothetical protein